MKIQSWDFFNFSETSELFKELIKDQPEFGNVSVEHGGIVTRKVFDDTESRDSDTISTGSQTPGNIKVQQTPQITNFQTDEQDDSEGGSNLEKALKGMCKRGGFHGAVIADLDGLPIAVYNSPVDDEILAAYSTILGESLEKAASFLNQPDANNISLDINMLDKIVLRKFSLKNLPYYIMVIAQQNVDERAEVELLISQISELLH